MNKFLPLQIAGENGSYWIHPQVQASLSAANGIYHGPSEAVCPNGSQAGADRVQFVTVVSSTDGKLDQTDIASQVAFFTEIDDVFAKDFLTDTVVVKTPVACDATMAIVNTKLGEWNPRTVLNIVAEHQELPSGPYFLIGSDLHQAWRLYPDSYDAFSVATVPIHTQYQTVRNYPFSALASMHTDGIWKNIAVPSRLYSQPSPEQPLAGKRISIKDNYRLSGVKATMSSRSWEATYGPDTESAKIVDTLLQLGAVIVGKSRMSAFASAEEPTDQCVDFHAPFNPRGDEYQTPAGSSSGAAAAVAGYEWLDFSLGTDTSGSIRYPAAICGTYGLRLTSHTVPVDGIWPCCREFDAVGLLGRDLASFHTLTKALGKNHFEDTRKYPRKIIYPTDFLPYTEEPVQAVLEEYVLGLEKYLGIERSVISIAERWKQCPPEGANGLEVKDFLKKTGFYPFYYDGYHEYDQFRDDYRQKFGKEPYVGPYMRWKWETGSDVTTEQVTQAMKEMDIFRRWFADNVFQKDAETASDAVMILPLSCYAPDYRDNIHKEPGSLPAFSENYLASLLRLPQLVLPVGQVTYESCVSGRTEYHPITASLLGASGSDLMLINLARESLGDAGFSEKVSTGRNVW